MHSYKCTIINSTHQLLAAFAGLYIVLGITHTHTQTHGCVCTCSLSPTSILSSAGCQAVLQVAGTWSCCSLATQKDFLFPPFYAPIMVCDNLLFLGNIVIALMTLSEKKKSSIYNIPSSSFTKTVFIFT